METVALLARLGCAAIVAPRGGVPLILDDALGHTDPERLQEMARVLSAAAESSQIIVLTCVPERYRALRNAEIVQLH